MDITSDLMNEFCLAINENDDSLVGDILEFGTGSGRSTALIAMGTHGRKIITFDGFRGLPPTSKPNIKGWEEGELFFDEKTTRAKLARFPNVSIYKAMTYELKDPADYGISKIAAINIDVDLYEGTLDAFRFCEKCQWDRLLIRFDDWGAYDHQDPAVVDGHEKQAFYDYIKETNHVWQVMEFFNGHKSKHGYLQAIVYMER